MSAPTYITGKAGSFTFDSTAFAVKQWSGTHSVSTDDVTNSASAGYEECIPTLEKFEGSATLFYDPAASPLGVLVSTSAKIFPGKFASGTLKVGTGTGSNTYACTAFLITAVKPAVAAASGITIDVDFRSSGAVTVAAI